MTARRGIPWAEAVTWSATAIQSGQPSAVASLKDGRLLAIGSEHDWIYDPNALAPPAQGDQGLGSPQMTVILGGIAVVLALLVLAQFMRARVAERRRVRVVPQHS